MLVAWLILQRFLPSYFSEKAKNLATKEDVAAITEEVERVRHEYSALVEELKARHQLRLAALDRRLQAHQEAFTLWRGLVVGPEDSGASILACQSWWEKNCLYLEPDVREAFVLAYSNASLRDQFISIRADANLITEAWDKMMKFPDVLFAAVQLPPMSELETESMSRKPSSDNKI